VAIKKFTQTYELKKRIPLSFLDEASEQFFNYLEKLL